jgi:hypothetical protein
MGFLRARIRRLIKTTQGAIKRSDPFAPSKLTFYTLKTKNHKRRPFFGAAPLQAATCAL